MYLLTVKKCHGDSIKNKSTRAKKTREGAPAPARLGFNSRTDQIVIKCRKQIKFGLYEVYTNVTQDIFLLAEVQHVMYRY